MGLFLTDAVATLRPIFEPLPDQTVAEWATENITLPEGEGAEGAEHPDWALTPDVPEVIEHIKNPDVREVVLAYAAQCSKTISLIVMVGWLIKHLPMNILWVIPDQRLLRKLVDQRIRKIFQASNVGLGQKKRDQRMDFLRFTHCELHAGIASSPTALASSAMGIVVIDEEDENPEFTRGVADPAKLARVRMRTFRQRSKFLRACTPRRTERGIWPTYNSTRMYTPRVRCPHCRKFIKLEFRNIKWPHDSYGHSVDGERIKTDNLAHYLCQKCEKKIQDHQREEMLATIKWECETPDRPISRVGFHKSALYSVFESWSSLAAEFLDSKDDVAKLNDFNHSQLAEPKDVSMKYIKESELRDQLPGAYDWGSVPDEVQALTYGADVGGDHLWVVVLGWGYAGELFKIVSTRIKIEDTRVSLEELWDYCQVSWEGNQKARMMGGGIDAGYNTGEVYAFCKRHPIWRPMMGADRRLTAPWVIGIADPKRRYKDKARGLQLYTIHADHFQDVLQGYLNRGKGEGSGFFHVPNKCEDRYYTHLSNEVRKKVNIGTRTVERWQPRYTSAPQHLRDATKYAIAEGHIRGLDRIRRPKKVEDMTDAEKRALDHKTARQKSRLTRIPTGWESTR